MPDDDPTPATHSRAYHGPAVSPTDGVDPPLEDIDAAVRQGIVALEDAVRVAQTKLAPPTSDRLHVRYSI